MNRNSKKGFTIVELVIVIAVIAILAAVLIPTFAGIIKKANLSNDQQVVTNMNKELAIEFATGKPTYAGDALQALYAAGYFGDKLVPYTSGYAYVYDLTDNKFYLADDTGAIVFPEAKADKSTMWALYNDGGEENKVDGVTNYVFLASPANHYNYASAFKSGAYTLDLNGSVLSYSTAYTASGDDSSEETLAGNDSNITIVNGALIGEGNYIVGSNIETYISATNELRVYDENMVAENGTLTFEKYSFLGKRNATIEDEYRNAVSHIKENSAKGERPVTKYVFKDCIFADYSSFNSLDAQYITTITEVVFDNCKFVNTGVAIACNIKNNTTIITVTNCEFINCEAGISMRAPAAGSVISNNTFNIVGSGDIYGQAIQFYDTAIPAGNTTPLVTVSNNTIVRAESFIHAESVTKITSADWTKFVKFENNNYPEDLTKVTLSNGLDNAHKTALEALIP